MNDFHRCNKVTGIYWLKKPDSIKLIRVYIQPQDGISLPKFEDYSDNTKISVKELENNTEVYEFNWQEKVFCRWEQQQYSDVHNCLTDHELNYHDDIKNNDYVPERVFSYIHEDYYLPLPVLQKKPSDSHLLSLCFKKLNINEKLGRLLTNETSNSTAHLFKSEDDLCDNEEQWTAMHVVFDNSEYNDSSNLLLKQEAVLLSLYYNRSTNCLIISPDRNDVELNPYAVETSSGVRWGYKYGVEIEFEETESGEELMLLLRKLSRKWEKRHKLHLSFVMPPLGKTQYYVTLEILTADSFDMDNLYIDYTIKVPEQLRTKDNLLGSTHVSQSTRDGYGRRWNYGHLIELCFEIDTGEDPSPVTVILEAISTDWWGRHRTEGYSHLSLTLSPGHYNKQLSCLRPEEKDSIQANSRRFFIGGCHLLKDLDILTKPQIQDANFKFTTSGNIDLRWSVICQSQASRPSQQYIEYSSTNSSTALLLGAETALKKYKKARAKLAAATKEFGGKYEGSGDN